MGAETGDESDILEEVEDNEELYDFGFQLSFNVSTHQDEVPVSMESRLSAILRAINTASKKMQDSSDGCQYGGWLLRSV